MIVDLLRNDLGRIAELGSVRVDDLFAVETYPTLHTMVSTVTAQLKNDAGVEDIVRALFPCGSVTGAPKIRAMEIIRELEASPRGLYCGAIGHFAPDGSARFNVAIRTLTIRDGEGELGIGGAVVQDSRSGSEYDECLLKARYYEAARRPLELIETLRWSPDEGFVRLERHLERMERSARFFGIPFDRARPGSAKRRIGRPSGAPDAERKRLVRLHRSAARQGAVALDIQRFRNAACGAADILRATRPTGANSTSRCADCDETIFLNERGEVAEGSRSNIFVRRGGILLTPPLSAGILDGVSAARTDRDGPVRRSDA